MTFDDGPSENTDKILKILKKYDAKATFFVTGNNQKYNSSIKKAYKQGNTIALHTYTHDYATVYSSTDAYFEDLQKISDMVKKHYRKSTKIHTFPRWIQQYGFCQLFRWNHDKARKNDTRKWI